MRKDPATKTKNHFQSGFTLVELLTVMAIIVVIGGMMLANYRKGGRQVALDMQSYKLAQDLRRTQEWALAAHEVGGVAVNGYGVYVKPQENSYFIYLDNGNDGSSILPGNGSYDAGYDTILETINLNSGIEILSGTVCSDVGVCGPADWVSVEYMIPDPTTKMNGGDNIKIVEVVFRIKGTSTTGKVVVNKAGLVYVE
jgi:prepilin-type N-terminal cleavage/methylation domain-containing protein